MQTTAARGRHDLSASVHSAYDHIPSRFWFLPIKKGNVRVAGFFGLINATADGGGPLAAPRTLDTLLSLDEGDGAGGAWLLSVFAALVFPHAQVWGDVAAVARTDAAYGRRFFAAGADRGSVIGSPGTELLWAGGRLLDAWPANPDENEYSRVRDSNVATLLIGGQLDSATPPQNATSELLPHLPNGHQVVLPKLGHADDFWAYEPDASTRLIDTFLDTGRVDTSLYTDNRLDFTSSVTHSRIAEIVISVFLGFAGLVVLSLLWLARRLRRGAMFGQKGSVAVRSLLPLVLGFGGWCLGVLIVLVALPTVPVTDEMLAVVSIAPACCPRCLRRLVQAHDTDQRCRFRRPHHRRDRCVARLPSPARAGTRSSDRGRRRDPRRQPRPDRARHPRPPGRSPPCPARHAARQSPAPPDQFHGGGGIDPRDIPAAFARFLPKPIRSLAARSPAYRLGYDLPIDGGMAFRGSYLTRICTPG